ncbi:MAG: putative porin [Vicinamibacterales bacterium]
MKRTVAVFLFTICPALAFAQSSQPAAQPPAQKPWWERITFFGDFRARYEGFFLEDTATRHRQRFRLRLGLRTNITEQVGFNVRLASGDANDIISTNQTLTGFWSRKPINIDQVFATWAPKPVPGLTLGFGKYAYPVTRTQLVWDDDLNWEGTYQQYATTIGKGTIRLAAAQSPLNETTGGNDAFLWAEQAQVGMPFGAHQLQVSLASYAFPDIDQLALAIARGPLITVNTNATTTGSDGAINGFLSDFHVVDLIGHATLATGAAQYPLQLVAEWAFNTRAATDEDSAIWLVGTIGRAASPRTAGASYTYARVERDAVLSAFRYSDMPGTNIIGHQLAASYMPVNRVNIDVAAILTKALQAAAGSANRWLTRLQIDGRVTF